MAADARHPDSSARILREIILDHLNKHIGKTSAELKRDVIDDFGSLSRREDSGDRLFLRHLQILIDLGCVRRDEDFDLEMGQMRPLYFLVKKEMPPPCREFCRKCGLIGSRTSRHPEHRGAMKRYRASGKPLEYAPGFSPAERQPSARTPGRAQPAGSAGQPDRPRRAARRER